MRLLQPLPPMPAILGWQHMRSFRYSSNFLLSTFPAMQYHIVFLFLIPFLIWEFTTVYHKDSNMFLLLNKVKPCSAEIVLGWVTKYEYPVL